MSTQNIMRQVIDAMSAGTLTLPTLPDVAVTISRIVRSEGVDAAAVAAEVVKDPAMAAGLLRYANSAAIRGSGARIDNLQQAIARLGFNMTRALVNRMAIQQLFVARNLALIDVMKSTWSRSLEVAALSKTLAERHSRLNPETAMMAGLIHRVGVLPLAKIIDQNPALIADDAQLHEVMESLHARVGRLVLRNWKFPDELQEVTLLAADFLRTHSGPPDYADIVSVALLELYGESDPNLAGLDRSRLPAMAKLGLSPDVRLLDRPEIRAAHKANLEMISG